LLRTFGKKPFILRLSKDERPAQDRPCRTMNGLATQSLRGRGGWG